MRVATRMHGPAFVTTTAASKYTTPANTKAIIRHIHLQNPSGASVAFTMSIGADTTSLRLFDGFSIGAGQVLDHMCYYVLEETEIIQAWGGTANILVLTIDGDQAILA